MLKELFESVCNLATRAITPCVIQLPAEPSHRYGLFDGEKFKVVDALRNPRADYLFSLKDFCLEVAARKTEKTTVFCGNGKTTAILDDDADRRERIMLNLPFSTAMKALQDAEAERQAWTQTQFVELLRITFNGCIEATTVYLFKAVKSTANKTVDSGVRTGMSRLDAKVVNEILADGKPVPNEIEFTVYAYRDLVGDGTKEDKYRHKVKCAVACDLLAEGGPKFVLIPLAGELARVMQNTDAAIRENIKSDTGLKQVYCGKP